MHNSKGCQLESMQCTHYRPPNNLSEPTYATIVAPRTLSTKKGEAMQPEPVYVTQQGINTAVACRLPAPWSLEPPPSRVRS